MSDIDGLDSLIADLTAAYVKAGAAAGGVVQKGALNVKQDAQRLSSGLSHAPLYPQSITYDAGFKSGGWEALIGPDKERPQGALGNLLEYGSANNAPHTHLGPALDREAPRFVMAIAEIAERLL